jgi:hypothetical protein
LKICKKFVLKSLCAIRNVLLGFIAIFEGYFLLYIEVLSLLFCRIKTGLKVMFAMAASAEMCSSAMLLRPRRAVRRCYFNQ